MTWGSGAPTWYGVRDDDEAARDVGEAFARAYGSAPEGVWAAPGRVNLIGEHVDYNAGICMPLALPHRAYAALRRRRDDRIRILSSQMTGEGGRWEGTVADVAPGRVGDWAGYVAGVAWALRSAGYEVGGFDAVVDSAVPIGAGLSSSAALECCVAVGLDELHGLGLGADDAGRRTLAAVCVRAENDIAGAPTGGMDQAASLRCTSGHCLLLDCRDFAAEHVAFDPGAHGLALLVIDTRAHHSLTDGQYGSRRDLCHRASEALGVASLREVADRGAPADGEALRAAEERLGDGGRGDDLRRVVRHVVTEIGRVREVSSLLRDNRPDAIGPLLDASHASLRDDYRVSCPELDAAVDAATAAGALGARMTGGGFGGSAIALVRGTQVDAVAGAVHDAFGAAGFAAPGLLRAVPSAAAGRVA